MTSSTRKKNSEPILARVPAVSRARIEEAAACRGMSVRGFIIDAAVKEAQHVIENERLIQLSREDAALVVSLLDDPPAPNAALQKAAETHKRLTRA
jgi:uncharacterized protein (DUF1778 family)